MSNLNSLAFSIAGVLEALSGNSANIVTTKDTAVILARSAAHSKTNGYIRTFSW